MTNVKNLIFKNNFIEKMSKKMLHSNSSPNILISTDNGKEFQAIKSFLKSIIGTNSYTIYQLNSQELVKPLWIKNCILLVDTEPQNVNKLSLFTEYLKQGGKILSVPVSVDKKELKKFDGLNAYTISDDLTFESDYQNEMKLVKEKLFEFETLDDSIYYYPVYNGLHYVSKVLIKEIFVY